MSLTIRGFTAGSKVSTKVSSGGHMLNGIASFFCSMPKEGHSSARDI